MQQHWFVYVTVGFFVLLFLPVFYFCLLGLLMIIRKPHSVEGLTNLSALHTICIGKFIVSEGRVSSWLFTPILISQLICI